MSEGVSLTGVNLHGIEALQRVEVRGGVSLRPMMLRDSDRILDILSRDNTIRDHVSIAAKMHTEDDVAQQVAEMESDPECIRYIIADREDKAIGLVSFWLDPGFFGQTPLPNTYGFGYFLDPNERGKGIVTTAVEQLMAAATASVPDIQGFTAFCVDENKESIAVLNRLGFQPTESLYAEPDNGWQERQYIKGLADNA